MAQLELSTTREREFITIDGKDYTLRAYDDLDLQATVNARRVIRQLSPEGLEKITPKAVEQAREKVNELVRWLLPALEQETFDKLNFAKRLAIVYAALKGSGDFMKTEEDETEI